VTTFYRAVTNLIRSGKQADGMTVVTSQSSAVKNPVSNAGWSGQRRTHHIGRTGAHDRDPDMHPPIDHHRSIFICGKDRDDVERGEW
jgi:hypothetical protein